MVIKHSTVHNPNEIVPSADWNADHTGTATAEPHTLASHSTKAHAELTNVTADQHHAQSHTLASHSTKAHAELTNVTSDQHHAQSHNMASHTDDYSAGEGIDISVGNVISGEDATTANKGIASFNTFDFSVAAGAVSLDDDIISTIGGDAGTATGLGHNINILGGEGIDTSGLNDDITISGEDATIANKGIASFNTLNFSVAGGAVSLGAQGVNLNMGTHKIVGVVDPTANQEAATKKYVDDNITAITSYETAWINRSDWTNVHLGTDDTKNVSSNLNHALGAPITDIIVKVLVSITGADNDCFEVGTVSDDSYRKGYILQAVDDNNIIVQTSTLGMNYLDADGLVVDINTQDWYYKIKVWKLG